MSQTKKSYVVECIDCGGSWEPPQGSPAWWYAKQQTEKNPKRLDCPKIRSKMCGCGHQKHKEQDALYHVSGYNDLCEDFDYGFDKFTDAIRLYRERECDPMCEVFITGISKRVEHAIKFGLDYQKKMDEARRDYQAESQREHEEFEQGLQEFFDVALDQVEDGKMDPNQLRPFFNQVRH